MASRVDGAQGSQETRGEDQWVRLTTSGGRIRLNWLDVSDTFIWKVRLHIVSKRPKVIIYLREEVEITFKKAGPNNKFTIVLDIEGDRRYKSGVLANTRGVKWKNDTSVLVPVSVGEITKIVPLKISQAHCSNEIASRARTWYRYQTQVYDKLCNRQDRFHKAQACTQPEPGLRW